MPGEAAEVGGEPIAGGAVVVSGSGVEAPAARLPTLRILRLLRLLAVLARLRSLPIRRSGGSGRAVLAEHRASERSRAPAAAAPAGVLGACRLRPWLGLVVGSRVAAALEAALAVASERVLALVALAALA